MHDRLRERRPAARRRVARARGGDGDLEGAGRRAGRGARCERRRRRAGRSPRARRPRQGGVLVRGRGLRVVVRTARTRARARHVRREPDHSAGSTSPTPAIGSRWRVGTAVLEVSQPRFPCFKLGIRMGDAGFVKRVRARRALRRLPPHRRGGRRRCGRRDRARAARRPTRPRSATSASPGYVGRADQAG